MNNIGFKTMKHRLVIVSLIFVSVSCGPPANVTFDDTSMEEAVAALNRISDREVTDLAAILNLVEPKSDGRLELSGDQFASLKLAASPLFAGGNPVLSLSSGSVLVDVSKAQERLFEIEKEILNAHQELLGVLQELEVTNAMLRAKAPDVRAQRRLIGLDDPWTKWREVTLAVLGLVGGMVIEYTRSHVKANLEAKRLRIEEEREQAKPRIIVP